MLSAEARRQAVEDASRALSGTINPVLAVRQLVGLRRHLKIAEADPGMLCIISLESETDAIPVGVERDRWAAEVLRERAVETQRPEEQVLKQGGTAFHNVVQRWSAA